MYRNQAQRDFARALRNKPTDELEAIRHDNDRTRWLRLRGFHVTRFRNQALDESIHEAVAAIAGTRVRKFNS